MESSRYRNCQDKFISAFDKSRLESHVSSSNIAGSGDILDPNIKGSPDVCSCYNIHLELTVYI
jgi:hypothetical protein